VLPYTSQQRQPLENCSYELLKVNYLLRTRSVKILYTRDIHLRLILKVSCVFDSSGQLADVPTASSPCPILVHRREFHGNNAAENSRRNLSKSNCA
jgi:hypothetical protein